jgi:hypothetical protein
MHTSINTRLSDSYLHSPCAKVRARHVERWLEAKTVETNGHVLRSFGNVNDGGGDVDVVRWVLAHCPCLNPCSKKRVVVMVVVMVVSDGVRCAVCDGGGGGGSGGAR